MHYTFFFKMTLLALLTKDATFKFFSVFDNQMCINQLIIDNSQIINLTIINDSRCRK